MLVTQSLSVALFPGQPPPAYTNRLIGESSPYLQQHAHNPVDWYPWGNEAFDKARREDKPIFLSIGYSTCHWCHVMEEESFTNAAIAAYLNEHFVAIKVDREERPDLDRVYQNYVIGVAEGGWPASLFLTPDLKPFFGANYMPPEDRGRELGFPTILRNIVTLWTTNRDAALLAAAQGHQALAERSQATTGGATLDPDAVLAQAHSGMATNFDAINGGFGGAPKFPRPVVLNFLLRYYARTGEKQALDMTVATLRAMARGGIHDQLAGGFHRYATDAAWKVPHFEKMLYDQAQLAVAYTEAYQATGDRELAAVSRDTLDYVLRDMRDRDGAFYSAEDADSKATANATSLSEGAFYLWTRADLDRILGADAEAAAHYYGITDNTPRALSVSSPLAPFASSTPSTSAKAKLLAARAARPRPLRDGKILAAWNGLMLSALARAAQAFDEQGYLDAATRQATFIERRLYDVESGTLKRRFHRGTASIDGLLEDYAFLIQGVLDLYEASADQHWLEWAARLQDTQDSLFWDATGGGYFSTRANAGDVVARAKEEYDGSEPSANSIAAMNLLRLWRITTAQKWRARADGTIAALTPRASRSSASLPQLLAAINFATGRSKEIVIIGSPKGDDTRVLLRLVHQRFIPNKVVVVTDEGAAQQRLQPLVPFIDGMVRRDGRATIYVCENYACRLPTSDPATAARLLAE